MHSSIVIFATDFSDYSTSAFTCATAQAHAMNAHLVIVHVKEFPIHSGEGMLHAGIPSDDAHLLEKRLQQIVPEDFAGTYEHVLLTGEPAHEIVRLAKEREADLLVLASHGRTGLSRLLIGSVAEKVLRHSPCTVLVVKNPAMLKSAPAAEG